MLTPSMSGAGGIRSLIDLGQERLDLLNQHRKGACDDPPDDRIIRLVLAMNEPIAQADDLPVIRDPFGRRRVDLLDPSQCLADDLEIVLGCLSNTSIEEECRK